VTDGDLGQRLLAHLRGRLDEPRLGFSEPPASVPGGFDTQIFAFRLRGAPPAFSGPLILRVLGAHQDPARALREGVTQNTLAEMGYPAPRALLLSADPAPLGGAFIIMERLPGMPLIEAGVLAIGRVLVEMQLRLHALDAETLLRALAREDLASTLAGAPPIGRERMTLEGYLAGLEDRAARSSRDGLAAGLAWLVDRRPPEPERRVICHGDFHPQNIFVSGDAVTGVIDWPNAIVADPAYDVAATKTILSLTPLDLSGAPPAFRWLIRVARPALVKRYLGGYRRQRPLDPEVLAYYEALSCMRQLIRVTENRLRSDGEPISPLDASAFGERVAARFCRITGIAPMLPAVKT
jgi:aminoglycoside phosphotransferase (APT) family kinase protein